MFIRWENRLGQFFSSTLQHACTSSASTRSPHSVIRRKSSCSRWKVVAKGTTASSHHSVLSRLYSGIFSLIVSQSQGAITSRKISRALVIKSLFFIVLPSIGAMLPFQIANVFQWKPQLYILKQRNLNRCFGLNPGGLTLNIRPGYNQIVIGEAYWLKRSTQKRLFASNSPSCS